MLTFLARPRRVFLCLTQRENDERRFCPNRLVSCEETQSASLSRCRTGFCRSPLDDRTASGELRSKTAHPEITDAEEAPVMTAPHERRGFLTRVRRQDEDRNIPQGSKRRDHRHNLWPWPRCHPGVLRSGNQQRQQEVFPADSRAGRCAL